MLLLLLRAERDDALHEGYDHVGQRQPNRHGNEVDRRMRKRYADGADIFIHKVKMEEAVEQVEYRHKRQRLEQVIEQVHERGALAVPGGPHGGQDRRDAGADLGATDQRQGRSEG